MDATVVRNLGCKPTKPDRCRSGKRTDKLIYHVDGSRMSRETNAKKVGSRSVDKMICFATRHHEVDESCRIAHEDKREKATICSEESPADASYD
jgi:recombinational DNA repair protein RecR